MTLPQAVGSRAVRRRYLTLYRECVSTLQAQQEDEAARFSVFRGSLPPHPPTYPSARRYTSRSDSTQGVSAPDSTR